MMRCAAAVFPERASARRDSPSFPTRRSSDLGMVSGDFVEVLARRRDFAGPEGVVPSAAEDPFAWRGWDHTLWRSEEHTSELQSRRDLVCRLLLEKKKSVRPGTLRNSGQSL